MREIVESGGAPSVQELMDKIDQLGAKGHKDVYLATQACNNFFSFINDKLGGDQKQEIEIEPKNIAIASAQSAIRQGNLAEVHAHLEKLIELNPSEWQKKRAVEAKFLIETHIFAGSFSTSHIDNLRQQYINKLSFG